MKPIYKKLLKELEKGNVVLLEVRGSDYNDRLRLVSPENCEYICIHSDNCFYKSCFIEILSKHLLSPKTIVMRMELYDRYHSLKLREMQVLK